MLTPPDWWFSDTNSRDTGQHANKWRPDPAAHQQDRPGGRVSQKGKVDHLLGEGGLGLKGQQAVFEEGALARSCHDGDPPIWRVGGKGQVGPLPAEGGGVEIVTEGQGADEQKSQEDEK